MADREFPIIVKLGGRDAVFADLKKMKVVNTPDALRMAATRGAMSGDLTRALMSLADERSLRYDASDFEVKAA